MKVFTLKEMNNKDYVTFEQAEMLALFFNYDGETDTAYSVDTKELFTTNIKHSFNRQKMWGGIYGWKYSAYSAPTKDEAIEWLMNKLDTTLNIINK